LSKFAAKPLIFGACRRLVTAERNARIILKTADMLKKILLFIIILIALLGVLFFYNYFINSGVKAPTIENNKNQPTEIFQDVNRGFDFKDFQGPAGPPSIKGPTGPPPQ